MGSGKAERKDGRLPLVPDTGKDKQYVEEMGITN